MYMVLTFSRSLVIFLVLQVSTTNMHQKMVKAVIRAKILFFDSNPLGRIQTRFSKDVTTLDLVMPGIAVLVSFGIWRAISVAIVIVIVHWEMSFVLLIATVIMLMV